MSQLYATTANLAHQLYVESNPPANIAADNFHIEDVTDKTQVWCRLRTPVDPLTCV